STLSIPRADSCGEPGGRTCESLIGDVVADAMRSAYGVDFAITSSGSLRSSLTCPGAGNAVCDPSIPPPYPITAGEILAAVPFGDHVMTTTVTGDLLKLMLENAVSVSPAATGGFPQLSGLCVTY